MKRRYEDLAGKKFNRLLVVKYVGTDNYRRALFECKCDCGNICTAKGVDIKKGHKKSCGCLQIEKSRETMKNVNRKGLGSKGNLKHNCTHTKLYKHWCQIKVRCNNPKHENYKYYGGRGIKVCDEWNLEFTNFKEWALANSYEETLTIERIDVDGNYEPSNCKWITPKEQIRNRRNTVKLTYLGITKPLIEWCEIYKFKYKLAHARYRKGWNFERIFSLS